MPRTLRLRASDPQDITRAAELLRAGGTVAFPTETVYGLGANALSVEAVAGIFAAKQRPSWDPLIVHVADMDAARALVQVEDEQLRRVEALAAAFWPGPLTLLLPRRSHIPDAVTAGRPLVGVRVPAHPAAQALLQATGLPLAAPSANRFGHTSPTTAQHVLDDLDGRIDAVLDAGPTRIGLESTVLDPTAKPMILYRPGALTPDELARVAGAEVEIFQPAKMGTATAGPPTEVQSALPAPGVGLRHYAPRARLILVEGDQDSFQVLVSRAAAAQPGFGVLLPDGWQLESEGLVIASWGAWDRPEELAATLFSGLRSLDARGAEIIYCPLPGTGGLRDAIRDRLQKAARSA